MEKIGALLFFCGAIFSRADSFFPTEVNTLWQYEASGAAVIAVRVVGTEKSDEQPLVRLETRRNDALQKTELVAVEDRGLVCYRRISPEGKITSFNPPQLLMPNPLAIGAKWEMDDEVGNKQTHLQFEVTAEEEVSLPFGNFHAFRAQCDQPWPLSATIERWFVPGLGMVKEVTTTRGPDGRLLERVTTVLTKFLSGRATASEPGPSVVVPSSSPPSAPSFKLEIAKDRDAPPMTEIKSDVPNIFVRWSGENLPLHSSVRLAWVAEDVGDVIWPNFVVDETKTEIATSTFGARFTLSRPKDGWAAGKYRVDLYLDDQLAASANVVIRD